MSTDIGTTHFHLTLRIDVPIVGGVSESPRSEEGFDQILERLRKVVDRLEESLKMFEEGVLLARRGHALLDAAEKRVETLVKGRDGEDAAEPLSEEDAS